MLYDNKRWSKKWLAETRRIINSEAKPKWKTARQLRIRQDEYEALIAVRDDLATGRLVHIHVPDNWLIRPVPLRATSAEHFNMDVWSVYTECGTVHCIGGAIEARIGRKIRLHDSPMRELFIPPETPCFRSNDITAAQAVQAIDNYLATGKPNWESISA